MSSPVEVELTHQNGVPILRISGEMRLDVGDIERSLNRLPAGRPHVVIINLSGLRFISAAR